MRELAILRSNARLIAKATRLLHCDYNIHCNCAETISAPTISQYVCMSIAGHAAPYALSTHVEEAGTPHGCSQDKDNGIVHTVVGRMTSEHVSSQAVKDGRRLVDWAVGVIGQAVGLLAVRRLCARA